MKNDNKPTPGKLTAKFDNQLMSLLMADLETFRAKNPNNIRKVGVQQQLQAA